MIKIAPVQDQERAYTLQSPGAQTLDTYSPFEISTLILLAFVPLLLCLSVIFFGLMIIKLQTDSPPAPPKWKHLPTLAYHVGKTMTLKS